MLVIGFNRPNLLACLLDRLRENGIEEVFIALDGPRNKVDELICEESFKTSLSHSPNFNLRILRRNQNLGCCLGVVSALDWFFKQVNFGIILEDDCLPENAFFSYVEKSRDDSSGNQHEGFSIISGHNPFGQRKLHELTGYVLIHGWATWSSTWISIRNNYFNHTLPVLSNANGEKRKLRDAIYWWANSTRSRLGGVDTWDSIFAERVWRLGYKCLIPKQNLISNVGFGKLGTHTQDERESNILSNPEIYSDFDLDTALSRGYFGIKFRHMFTPFFKVIIDFLKVHKRKPFEEILANDAVSRSEIIASNK